MVKYVKFCYLIFRRLSVNGALQIPFSVTMAVMRLWSVTSNAGLKHFTSADVVGSLKNFSLISSGSLSSIGISAPVGQSRSTVEDGPRT